VSDQTVPISAYGFDKRPFLWRIGMDTGYAIGGFPVALIRFVLLVTLFALGVGTLVIGIGFPILVLALYVARRFADIERHWSARVRQRPVARPAYRSLDGRTGLKRLLTPLTEAQSWLDLVYGIFAFIPATIAFVFAVVWWAGGLGGTLFFAWGWSLPREHQGLAYVLGFGDTYQADLVVETAAGLIFLLTVPLVVRLLSIVNGSLSRAMLTSDWIGTC
jgi:hypothetical protein